MADFGNAVTVPGSNMGMWGEAMKVGGGTQDPWETFSNLTSNRNFLSLLAGVGSRLGKGGVGEAIGVPTQQMIQSMATQEAVGKAEGERKQWNQKLFDLLSGGFTPKDKAGPTSLKVNPDNMVLDISTASPAATVEGAEAQSPGGTVVGEGGLQPRTEYTEIPRGGGTQAPKFDLREVLGFWGTPSR